VLAEAASQQLCELHCNAAGLGRAVAPGASIVPLLCDRLIAALPANAGHSFARQRRALTAPAGGSSALRSAMAGPRRPFDPDDSNEAGLKLPVAESAWVKVAALASMLTLAVYIVLRVYDIARTHKARIPGRSTE
jgi:hypothetical protein